MADDSPFPIDPFDSILSPNQLAPSEAANEVAEVGQIVNDCTQLVASLQDTVEADIAACLNSCHGDYGLCQACIEGEISSHINAAGRNVMACGDKIIQQITAVTGEAWVRAFELGIPPANSAQLAAARAGEEIPIDPSDGRGPQACLTDDGMPTECPVILPPVVPEPPGNPIVTVPVPPPMSDRNLPVGPDGLECIPYQWSNTAINNWAAAFLSGEANSFVFSYPTETSTGVWQTPTTVYSIPKLCPRPVDNTVPTPPPPPAPPAPPDGTIITIPIPPAPPVTPPGGTIITVPSPPTQPGQTCPTPSITVNVPPCPVITPPAAKPPDQTSPTCPKPKCLVCFGDGTTAIMDAADPRIANLPQGARILGCGLDDSSLQQLAVMCRVAPPVTITPEPPPPQTIPAPSPQGGNICSPETITTTAELADQFLLTSQGSAGEVADAVGTIVGSILVGALGKLTGLSDIPVIGPALGSLIGAIGGSFSGSVIRNVVQPKSADPNCGSDAFFIAAIGAAGAKLFGNWFGTVPPQTTRQWQYLLNYYCPSIIPSVPELNAMYSRGYITFDPWLAAVKMNGACPDWNRTLVESITTRIGIQDAFRLWKLGKITPEQFTEAWKRQGIDMTADYDKFKEAVVQYPGMADLVRMMVRDVADKKVVDDFGLDSEFNDKWIDTPDVPLRSWGESQGVNTDVAKAFWRAHWQAPSPQAIYEWLHRLRPDDRSDSDANPGVIFTKEQAANALKVADYVPGFIDNYLATSYRPYTRVDIRRMWVTGVFTSLDEVRQSYRDLGYDAVHAQNLANFTEVTSRPAKAALAGQLTAKEVANAYRDNLLREDEARTLLDKAGLDDEQIDATIIAADTRNKEASRKITVKSLRQRFFMGEFTDAEAVAELTGEYMAQAQAEQLVHLWAAERRAKQKEPTVAMLCKWYGQGMISIDDYLQRIRNLRYSEVDALRIVESCNLDVKARRQAEIEKALKQQAKDQQAANRVAAAMIRDARAAARALKLQHKITHKVQVKSNDGSTIVTTTDTTTDTPDINQTIISESVDIRTNGDV